MISKRIENIIVKYFSKSASLKDLEYLSDWLIEKENKKHFENFIKLNYYVEYNLMDFDSEIEKRKLFKRIQKKKYIIYMKSSLKYAAALLILVSVGYILTKNQFSKKNEVVVIENNIEIGTDKATLTLEDGTNVALEKGKEYKSEKVSSDGEKIVYHSNKEKPVEKIAFNYLTIPRGGEFYMELSDGTKVWLNADSQFKYPVKFVQGKPRDVELIYGEAYFDVSSSVLHNGDKFRVKKDNHFIEVIGTEFNVKAYKNENTVETILVEGKVSINVNDSNEELVPNHKLVYNEDSKEIYINKVDAAFETAWKTGLLRFKNKSLLEISNILERWYDIEFVFENETAKNVKITGVFKKYQNVEHALITLENLNRINYKIEDRIIYIK